MTVRTGSRPRVWLAVLTAAMVASSAATAQVLEIGKDGAVKVYDGPAVFDDNGATPILAASRKRPHRTLRVARPDPAATRAQVASMAEAARAADLSPDLMAAVAWRESGYRTDAISRAGAIGEMQLMPATARALHVDPADAGQNLKGGASYLNALMRRYDGDLVRTLAAYNAGPGAVDRFHGVPPYKETQAYVAAVLDRLSQAVMPAAPPVAAMRATR